MKDISKNNLIIFIVLYVISAIIWYSCEQGVSDYLIEKKVLPDTTIAVGDTLNLDLTEYFETTGNFSSHPNIFPEIEDTIIAQLNYDVQYYDEGSNFSVIGKKVGSTRIKLKLSWRDADNTVDAHQERSFILTVVEAG